LNLPDVSATMASAASQSMPWIYERGNDGGVAGVAYLSFGTPVGGLTPAEGLDYCGKVTITDVHVGGSTASGTAGTTGVPASCDARDLSPEEKALEFMLFDIPVCVETMELPPISPPTPPGN
jgi:hypothetical protein